MLIGLHGKARAGKDTAYGFINEVHDDAEHESFASKLKLSAARLLYPGIGEAEALRFCDWLKVNGRIHLVEETGCDTGEVVGDISGRQFLQRYGTEAHRDVFGKEFWVNASLPESLDHSERVIVFTDVRFPNEAERIKELGGEIWHIVRPEVEGGDTHASEQVLPDELIDIRIDNDGTLDELRQRVIAMLAKGEQ